MLAVWADVIKRTGLNIEFRNRMLAIDSIDGGFRVKTQNRNIECAHVLLAIGWRGTPRRLDVSGEDLPKVSYRLIDPEQYRDPHVLVVGGGDSAVEAAIAISGVTGAVVSLSCRGKAFNRIKPGNRTRLDDATSSGRLRTLLESNVLRVLPDKVTLDHDGREFTISNDAIIVCAGGVLPTEFLRSLGVEISTHFDKSSGAPSTVRPSTSRGSAA